MLPVVEVVSGRRVRCWPWIRTWFGWGSPYNPEIGDWSAAAGIGQLRLTPGGAEFLLPIPDPARHEIRAIRQGTAEFALLPADRWTVVLYQFTDPQDSNPKHGLPWSDAVWEYHRQAGAEMVAVPGEPGSTFVLTVILVDTATGIVEALRAISPTVRFADPLREAATRQAATPRDDDQATRDLQDLYRRFSSTDLLLRSAVRFQALRDGTVE